MTRRTFTHTTAKASIALSFTNPFSFLHNTNSVESLNIGIIGVGLRGQAHLNLLLSRKDCNVEAICDIDKGMIERSLELYRKNEKSLPKVYNDGPYDYKNLLTKEDIDLVIIATPWEWHIPMAIDALDNKIYTGMEVSGASSINECWSLVETAERNNTPLYFLENVCFRKDVMAVLNMVRDNLFGELIHAEGGYQHDLRGVKFNDGITPYNSGVEYGEKGYSEARWRTQHSIHRNGDLYPTHGLGPVAQYLNVNKGNRLVNLTSISSKSRGLNEYIINHPKGGQDHPNSELEFNLGDKVISMISTSNGETILLHHDTNLPRPYSLGFVVQGTKGIWRKVRNGIHIEGISPPHRWEDAGPYYEKYNHPLWSRYEDESKGAGHGGMDFFLINSLVEHVKRGIQAPFDVYDAATWMSITPLSEKSIAQGSNSVSVPDFTNGRWINAVNKFALGDIF